MQYWWVNQNQTFKAEVDGGFRCLPKTRADGAKNQFYEKYKIKESNSCQGFVVADLGINGIFQNTF